MTEEERRKRQAEAQRKWQAKNKEYTKQWMIKYREENREKLIEYSRRYRAENQDKIKLARKDYWIRVEKPRRLKARLASESL